MKRVFKHTVPVDTRIHQKSLNGDPLHVSSRFGGEVEFWAEFDDDAANPAHTRHFTVVGTGHAIPTNAIYWGTTYDGWHLYEVT